MSLITLTLNLGWPEGSYEVLDLRSGEGAKLVKGPLHAVCPITRVIGRHYDIHEIIKHGDEYMVMLTGGNADPDNSPIWPDYLMQLQFMLGKLYDAGYDAWIEQLTNCVSVDVHTIYIGFKKRP